MRHTGFLVVTAQGAVFCLAGRQLPFLQETAELLLLLAVQHKSVAFTACADGQSAC
jgi:hypothetical protein